MSGDYTKFTFKPKKDYSAVLKQQGRVDLDADFNELIEIIDRRWRSETIDIMGYCVVPNTTKDAFLITPTGVAPGAFDIGIGRMYVDGIEVECHGLPPDEYQADLGEMRGTLEVPYNDQPYLPAPLPPALSATPGTTDLVYIDVWQREVTVLEDPTLREIALGGPDTTNRVQAAWQVRVLEDVGQHACGDSIQSWDDLVAPSAGRLTTSAVAPPASDDPCIIAPTGGYRGLENRLYRVEIHSIGRIGGGAPAKFKWSRNNATVASAVTAIPPSMTQVTVAQVGRDQVLRFDIGNWIEITDDYREFQGLVGHMAQITAIDEANRVLTFAPAIPGTINFDATNASRHTRVRRWDQSQNVDANGLLDVVAGPIDIEDGIRVTFSLDPGMGNFKVGDYWVFAARTADGSVEVLTAAPPRGILHHYCRLGFIHWGTTPGGTTFTDCRNHWPPLCCEAGCTVTVGDGVDSHGQFTDIQQAIDALGNRGGVVCIGRGVYLVTQTIQLNATPRRNIIIRGMGPATRILFVPQEGALDFMDIDGAAHISIEHLFVATIQADTLIRFTRSDFCTVKACTLVNLGLRGQIVEVEEPEPSNGRAIEFLGACIGCLVKENNLLAPKGVISSGGEVQALEIKDNRMLTRLTAIEIKEANVLEIVHNHLAGLDLERASALFVQELSRDNIDEVQEGVSKAFGAAISQTTFQAAGIILFAVRDATVRDNWIVAQVGLLGYLVVNGRIVDNQCLAFIGLFVIFGALVQISDNLILGLLVGILHVGLVVDFRYEGNTFLGFFGIELMSLAEMARVFGPLLELALGKGEFTADPTDLMARMYKSGKFETSGLTSFSLAAILKVHRNLFVTFRAGIQKTGRVLSGDVSVIDNTFLLCTDVGVELGTGHQEGFAGFRQLINPRHLIQSNAFNVSGTGIVSACDFTQATDNTIFCGNVGVDLDAQSSVIRNNTITASQREAPEDSALIVLRNGASDLRVTGNELFNGPSHGILFTDDIARVQIDQNRIRSMRLNGVTTANDLVSMRDLEITSNYIVACTGGGWRPGVIVLAQVDNATISNNSIIDNPAPNFIPTLFYAIYANSLTTAKIVGNTLDDNRAGIRLNQLHGDIRLQGNAIRNNFESALVIVESDGPLLIQDNHFSMAVAGIQWVRMRSFGSLQIQGNHFLNPGSSMCVSLVAQFVIFSGNIVRQTRLPAGFATSVIMSGPGSSGRAVITSNLTTGFILASGYLFLGGLSIANNLFLP